jgi:serine/threonine protein kinase
MQEGLKARAEARVGLLLRDKWRLDRLLGVGGCAAVYAATHRAGKRVAVKILHPELATSPEICRRFLREAYAANAVEHPGVVSVLDDDTTSEGIAFLVMDLLEGETLDQRRKAMGGRLDPADVLALLDQILDVLAAAHEKGIVHRDLKPENLFLTKEGRVRILDFGIARFRESSAESSMTELGTTMGSPAFMPPEQARGRWDLVDPRTDIWALGATLFTLLSGKFVHGGGTRNEALIASATKPAPSISTLVPSVPAAVAALVDRALAFDREARWQSARSMQEAGRMAYQALSGGASQTVPLMAAPNLAEVSTGGVTTSGAWSSGQGAPASQTSEPGGASLSVVQATSDVGPGKTVMASPDDAPRPPVITTISPETSAPRKAAPGRSRSSLRAVLAVGAGLVVLVGAALLLRSSGAMDRSDTAVEPAATSEETGTSTTAAPPASVPPPPSASVPLPPTVTPAPEPSAPKPPASVSAVRPSPVKAKGTTTVKVKEPPAVIDLAGDRKSVSK